MIPILELQQRLWQLSLDSKKEFYCIELSIPEMEFLPWLNAQTEDAKFYWCNRENTLELAAIGICDSIDSLNSPQKLERARYLGGIAFDKSAEQWRSFGAEQFILPRLVISKTPQGTTLTLNLNFRDRCIQMERNTCLKLLATLEPEKPLLPLHNQLLSQSHSPEQGEWHDMINQALAAQLQGELDKVVLSRKTQLGFQHEINPWLLLDQWSKVNQHCFKFAVQFKADQTFVGCSPERLYQRSEQTLKTEALAGTVSRGRNPEQDKLLENGLLNDPKLRHEHRLVQQYIEQKLAPFCADINIGTTEVIKLNKVQHLKQGINATLNFETSEQQLLSLLHPTPAVGGTPKEPACEFIGYHETYKRGWYAGAVGFVSEEQSEFCVAIRSALIEGNTAHIYAGAGIVEGSVAEQEWQELNNKIRTVTHLLTQPLYEKDKLDARA